MQTRWIRHRDRASLPDHPCREAKAYAGLRLIGAVLKHVYVAMNWVFKAVSCMCLTGFRMGNAYPVCRFKPGRPSRPPPLHRIFALQFSIDAVNQ